MPHEDAKQFAQAAGPLPRLWRPDVSMSRLRADLRANMFQKVLFPRGMRGVRGGAGGAEMDKTQGHSYPCRPLQLARGLYLRAVPHPGHLLLLRSRGRAREKGLGLQSRLCSPAGLSPSGPLPGPFSADNLEGYCPRPGAHTHPGGSALGPAGLRPSAPQGASVCHNTQSLPRSEKALCTFSLSLACS